MHKCMNIQIRNSVAKMVVSFSCCRPVDGIFSNFWRAIEVLRFLAQICAKLLRCVACETGARWRLVLVHTELRVPEFSFQFSQNVRVQCLFF